MSNFKVGDWKTRSLASGGFVDYFDEQEPLKYYKPKFKAGDWVRHIQNPEVIVKVNSINEEYQTFNSEWSWSSAEEDFDLWIPQEGEWCWFSYNTVENPILAQFEKIIDDDDHIMYEAKIQRQGRENTAITYEEFSVCEPFIGVLPSWIKE